MFLDLFGKKIINLTTPYKRSFITIENEDKETRAITLPSVRSSVFFLTSGDEIYIDNIDELERLCYVDYDLVTDKDKNYIKYFDDFNYFKERVKTAISGTGYYKMVITKKIIFSDVLHICCTEVN